MKTPIQELIQECETLKEKAFILSDIGYLDTVIIFLQSKLGKEEEIIIKFGIDCQEEMYCDNNGNLKSLCNPNVLFKQIFNNEIKNT